MASPAWALRPAPATPSVPADLRRAELLPKGSLPRPGPAGVWIPPAGRLVLGVPLALKMAGANAVVLVAALLAMAMKGGLTVADAPVLIGALAASFAISTLLVYLALEPVRALERAAREILEGDYDARVGVSVLADRDVRRIAAVMNKLLDTLTSDRERIRELGVRVVSAQDDERARVARELEDTAAQRVAALLYELRAELDRTTDRQAIFRLERLLGMAGGALEELRSVMSSVYPRVLTDLGLAPAIEWLARGVRKRHHITVTVNAAKPPPRLRPVVAAALFTVARDALSRAAARFGTTMISVNLRVDDLSAQLLVEDDGHPDSTKDALPPPVRERIALVDGWIATERTSKGGTAVLAVIPAHDR